MMSRTGKEGEGPMVWIEKWVLALSLTVCLNLSILLPTNIRADGEEQIRLAFAPYRQGPPHIEALSSGTTLTQSSWQAAEGTLPPEILRLIQAGEFEITIQETTDSPLPEAYVEATLKGAGQVQIGDDNELK